MGIGINFSCLPVSNAPLIAFADAVKRIDQARAIQAAADQDRIDQAMAIQAATDQTIAKNAEVCLVSFLSF